MVFKKKSIVLMMMSIEFFCDICDNLWVDRYYNNHLKSGTHNKNIHKRQRLISTKK